MTIFKQFVRAFYALINFSSGNKERRIILTPNQDKVQNVPFSAYISGNFDRQIGVHHPFIYDSIYINQGNAYNKFTGVFIGLQEYTRSYGRWQRREEMGSMVN